MEYRFLITDAEYGGNRQKGVFSSEYSLLELYFRVINEKFELLDELEIKIKPDDDLYKVNAKSLRAIGLDLYEHDKDAVTESKAKELVYDFLKRNSKDGAIKLLPSGQGVSGDIRYIVEKKMISQGNWEKFCSYQTIDLSIVMMILKILGIMPQTKNPDDPDGKYSNSLAAVAHYLNIPITGLHTAKGDCILFEHVMRKLFKFLKNSLPTFR